MTQTYTYFHNKNMASEAYMMDRKSQRENVVIGPEGTPLTMADLPKPSASTEVFYCLKLS